MAFLPTRQTVNKAAVFLQGHAYCVSLKEIQRFPLPVWQGLFRAIDKWVGSPGFSEKPRVFHGWRGSFEGGKYADCWVFKHTYNGSHYRLYGFIAHPHPRKRGMRAFVAVALAIKKTANTQQKFFNLMLNASKDQDALLALAEFGQKLSK